MASSSSSSSSAVPSIRAKADAAAAQVSSSLKSVLSSASSSVSFRSSVLGFPRFGSQRQLKTALESYWNGGISSAALLQTAEELKSNHWKLLAEKGVQIIPCNDFSFYDQVLDHAVLFNVIPQRVRKALLQGAAAPTPSQQLDLDVYFAMARGLQRVADAGEVDVFACEMKKYFDSNYHYLVPELEENQQFQLHKDDAKIKPIQEFLAAKAAGIQTQNIRPVVLGPITFLLLSKIVQTEKQEAEESKTKSGEDGAHSGACCHSDSASASSSITTAATQERLLSFLPQLLPIYIELLQRLSAAGAVSVQIDEPIFVTDSVNSKLFNSTILPAYQTIQQALRSNSNSNSKQLQLIVSTYYGYIASDCLDGVLSLPVDGFHFDLIRGGPPSPKQGNSYYPIDSNSTPSSICPAQADAFQHLLTSIRSSGQKTLPSILSLGIIDGRNIWRADLCAKLNELVLPFLQALKERSASVAEPIIIEIAPSCSLLHVPHSLNAEKKLQPEIKEWLAFATEKVDELVSATAALTAALPNTSNAVSALPREIASVLNAAVLSALSASTAAVLSHGASSRVVNPVVRSAVSNLSVSDFTRSLPHSERLPLQQAHLQLPLFPVTTIGSFPQTAELRRIRSQFRSGKISAAEYDSFIRQCIAECVSKQEELGIDVFVHGESERNDMVEFFGELLHGFAFTENGWVQSYGSRCVKPPILFGDVSRGDNAMTVALSQYAQSLTTKPMKAMLTGPVTLLQWSFVRDDQPRAETAKQLALAIRKEVSELESIGQMKIIQIDEAALREGLPLRQGDWQNYLQWSVDSFRLSCALAKPETQIHSHMCYSDFQDILPAIIRMDADVLTVENARSNSRIIAALKALHYPNKLAPGIYDIHSPRVPKVEEMIEKAEELLTVLKIQQIELVPDCGLKTRKWNEVMPALKNLVQVAKHLRNKYQKQ